jgi:DNA-binding PadR family transcriptional regulator
MDELSNSEAALLGLLSEEPMHPYKINQEFEYRNMHSWTELSMSSIYKLLRKLEKENLVTRENIVSEENRLQKQYSISEKGKQHLKQKLLSLLSTPEHMRWQLDIALYNSDLIPKNEVKPALEIYRTQLQKEIRGYKDLLQFLKDSDCPPHRFEVAKRPIVLLQADLAWVDSYLDALS